MKIVAMSDTHNQLHKIVRKDLVPDGDILVHAGDATGRGEIWEVERFCKDYGKLPHEHKIFVPGNHDWLFQKDTKTAREICDRNGIILLIDEEIVINGVKFYGSPWQPWFCDWAYNAGETESQAAMHRVPYIKPFVDMIPDDTNVLITHGPPYKILDELVRIDGTPKGQFVGSEHLLNKIKEIKPDIHIFGHIHCGYGEKHLDGTSYYNVAICDEMYYPGNEVKVIEL